MSDTSPRPWRTGNHVGRTIYRQDPDEPRGVLIGVMDTREDAALVVAAVNIGPQLEQSHRVAALIADHYRDRLIQYGESMPSSEAIDALTAVMVAQSGSTDPTLLGIADRPDVVTRLQALITHAAEENR